MSTNLERPPEDAEALALHARGGLSPSPADEAAATSHALAPHDTVPHAAVPHANARALTLGSLPVGARLVLRCRKDWRVATVSGFEPAGVRLNVASPSGHTYRVRRPPDSALTCEGPIPLLGELTPAGWRAALARYDARW